MTKKQRKKLRLIILTAFLLLSAFVASGLIEDSSLSHKKVIVAIIYLLPYLAIGLSVLKKATLNILRGQIFDENFLMEIATVGAFAIGEYPEAVFVMLFYQIGELFESIAVGKSRRSIAALMDITPDLANIERDGELVSVLPSEISVGEIFVVRAGEKIPIDGRITEGESTIDTSALTGESLPREVAVGDSVISGCLNKTSVIKIMAEKPYSESTATKIIKLMENAAMSKAKSESFITRFAKYYTPSVVMAALALAFLPPIFAGDLGTWVLRALNLLVISCPCALVISVPLSFFAGMGGASANGILIKGSSYLEGLAKAELVAFDKTGTLTEGRLSVFDICPKGISEDEFITLAATADSMSTHPMATALCSEYEKRYKKSPDRKAVKGLTELAGRGIKCLTFDSIIYIGNKKLMAMLGIEPSADNSDMSNIHLAVEQNGRVEYCGYALISDTPKKEAKEAISELYGLGVRKTVMLTGDSTAAAERVCKNTGLGDFHAELLPEDKVRLSRELMAEKKGGSFIYVGDGINDAPVLSGADVGVAMGALGSDAAIEAADVVIMDDSLKRLPLAVLIAKKTLKIVRQNVTFSLGVKLAVLVLSVLGLCPMWIAIFADVGVMIMAVLNAMRAMKV